MVLLYGAGRALLRLDDFEALHGGKVAHVEGGYGAASFKGCGCDYQIVIVDHPAQRFEICPKAGVFTCRLLGVWNDWQFCKNVFNLMSPFCTVCQSSSFHSMPDLCYCDRRNFNLFA
jgi:hypothetical protein